MLPLVSHGYVATSRPGGLSLLAGDTQFVSSWKVSLGRDTIREPVSPESVDMAWIEQAATKRNQPSDFVAWHRVRVGASGLEHAITITSLTNAETRVPLSLHVTSSMTDQFALRLDNSTFPEFSRVLSVTHTPATATVEVTSTREGYEVWHRRMLIQFPANPDTIETSDDEIAELSASWDIVLPALDTLTLSFHATDPDLQMGELPRITGETDLSRLLIPGPSGLPVPAAGAPWFMTLFGRDSLISSYLVRDDEPWLLENVVRSLASTQGKVTDLSRQEEPGKIVHEVRNGEFAALNLVPYGRYYGGADTTALWLSFLGLCSRATVKGLEAEARRALDWILTQLNKTGYIRYTPDRFGLIHQGWKDSDDAILDGGRLPDGPIALVEIQGYCYMALRAAMSMALTWSDPELSDLCRREAEALRDRFNNDFLSSDIPAVAFTDHPIYATSSNIGHLLFTGILTTEQARTVTDALLRPDMFTGYGIRTLSSLEEHYSPGSYHRGSVWPHDTALAMEGIAAYGWKDDAAKIADGLVDAAHQLGGLPEYILGLDSTMPAIKPVQSAMPQAWASAALQAAKKRRSS